MMFSGNVAVINILKLLSVHITETLGNNAMQKIL